MRPRPPLPQGPFLVVGLARSGRAAALALRARGEEVAGVDSAAPAAGAELEAAGVEVHVTDDGRELLGRARALIKSPGVPAAAPVVAAARAQGIAVLGELELGWRMLANEFIAVTGTNGKTTTVELVGHIHREAELPVALAGNVGTPVSALAGRVEEGAPVVCEVSSFQLEDALAFAPEAAVLLNLAPDHLDRHGSFTAYLEAKLSVFARQLPDDLAFAPSALRASTAGDWRGSVAQRLRALAARQISFGEYPDADLRLHEGALWWQGERLIASAELPLRGRHNVENAMAAAAVSLARGVDMEAVRAGLRSFTGVAHRLEEVAIADGVSFVNDSKATNVASTLVALEAFADDGAVHLILGGRGKGQDFSALRAPVARGCRGVYLIGEAAGEIAGALVDARVPLRDCGDLERAVAEASAAAGRGEVVLLSPACASFDQFADFEARGERFRALVGG